MNASRYIGRIGGLAVALGVGAAMFTNQGIALAAPDSSNSSDSSATGSDTGSASGSESGSGSATSTTDSATSTQDPTDDTSSQDPTDEDTTQDSADNTSSDPTDEDSDQDPADEDSENTAESDAVQAPEADAVQAPEADAVQAPETGHSSSTSTDVISSSHASSSAETNNGTGAFDEADVDTPSIAIEPPASSIELPQTATPDATPSPVSSAKSSLVAASATVAPDPATPNAATPAPRFSSVLATVVNRILNPFAGDNPAAPPVNPPSAWVLLGALQRERANAAAANIAPAGPTVSPTLVVDGYTITPSPDYPVTVTSVYNIQTTPPGVNQAIQGYQKFDVVDADGTPGVFYAFVSNAPYLTPPSKALVSSEVLYVDSRVANLLGESPGVGALPDGSVISTTTMFNGLLVNVYSAIASPDGNHDNDVVTNYLSIAGTGLTINLSGIVNALDFNAAYVPPQLPSYIRGVGEPMVTSISGMPPITVAVQGIQEMEYLNEDGTIGNFTALVTTTTDGVDFHTQALQVIETAPGAYAPPVGSVWNTVNFDTLSNVYSSIPQSDGRVEITNILLDTDAGWSLNLSPLFQNFNASAGLTAPTGPVESFSIGGYEISPVEGNQEVFTGINGLPPGNAVIQGVQKFDVRLHGANVGTIEADVANIPDMLAASSAQALLVTDSSSLAVPAGSLFDVRSFGFGFVNIYADIVGAGPNGENLVKDVLITPWGAEIDLTWLVQDLFADNGLNPVDGLVSYMDAAWLDLFNLA